MRPTVQIPSQPSHLLQTAIDDFRQLDRKRYMPNAMYYHRPVPGGYTTEVCLSGAVIAHTLTTPPTVKTTPARLRHEGLISVEHTKALIALNYARAGLWATMLALLGVSEKDTGERPALIDNLNEEIAKAGTSDFYDWPTLDRHLLRIQECAHILSTQGF